MTNKKYKGWTLKTDARTLSDFHFRTLKNQLPAIAEGGMFSMRITPPEPVGPCNYFDIRKGSSGDTFLLRFNIMNQDGTRQKYLSEDVDEANLEVFLATFMDRKLLPCVNRWTAEVKEA